jgi:purine-nucleoside phosphorylase
MSLHISAKNGEIAPVVLMPGDPLRAKYIAEKWLSNPVLVSQTRNVFYYTGEYNGTRLTIGASGMGCPSIGIYSYELYKFYEVQCIIRIGTAGAYYDDVNVYDIINADNACSESTYAKFAFGNESSMIPHQGSAFDIINETAEKLGTDVLKNNIHSSDIFYRNNPAIPVIAVENNCKVVEMEAFSLFANAKELGRSAATLLTVSDVIPTGKFISPEDREKSLNPMITLALESAVSIQKSI